MEQTANYGLNLWDGEDRILREDFNADHVKLEQALTEIVSNGVKIVTGSYTGTGTYGSSNPNSLTFDFEPKLLIITCSHPSSSGFRTVYSGQNGAHWVMDCAALTSSYTEGSGLGKYSNSIYPYGKKSGNTVYWYHTGSANAQMNTSSHTYHYVVIG